MAANVPGHPQPKPAIQLSNHPEASRLSCRESTLRISAQRDVDRSRSHPESFAQFALPDTVLLHPRPDLPDGVLRERYYHTTLAHGIVSNGSILCRLYYLVKPFLGGFCDFFGEADAAPVYDVGQVDLDVRAKDSEIRILQHLASRPVRLSLPELQGFPARLKLHGHPVGL